MYKKLIKEPVYKSETLLIIGTANDCIKEATSFFGNGPDNIHDLETYIKSGWAVFIGNDDDIRQGVIWLSIGKIKQDTIPLLGTVVHEAVHRSLYLTENLDISSDFDESETICYYTQFIVEEIMKFIFEQKEKDDFRKVKEQ